MNQILNFVLMMLILVISIAIHEFSHAIVGERLGDPTPRRQGRITLNPLAHLDRVGTLMIVMSSLAGFGIGWGKPVQVNPYNFRTSPQVGMGVVAVAGPISNVILAILGALVFQMAQISTGNFLAAFLINWVIINMALALFNLLPVFPLDGYNVFVAILHTLRQDWSLQLARFWQKQVQYGPLFLVLLLIIDWQFPQISPIKWVLGQPLWAIVGALLG